VTASELPSIVVKPTRGWRRLDLRELWDHRELLYFLTWRDIKVRYKQTAIGFLWVILQPLALLTAIALLFGRLAGISSDGQPYVLFALAGILPWQLFSRALSESTNSLVVDQRLITRVYFPRILVPTASVIAALLDFAITLVLALIIVGIYGSLPGAQVAALPLLIVILLCASLGVSYWLSALNLEYRDVTYAVPFLIQLWMFATPVVYPSSVVPARWRSLYALNPLVGVVDGFRWALLGAAFPGWSVIGVSALVAFTLFLSGIFWFRTRERTFVDAVGSGGR
jgi:lipopolysaccharide transport system permease protein